MINKTKVDEIHDQLPEHYKSRTNPNWNALVNAIGNSDETTNQLVAAVRQQFFIKTAQHPYLDRLAANNNVLRPQFLDMSDASFSKYVPVISYQPKQVKRIIDQLLGLFFFQESTTAFITSQQAQPFSLQDGYSLQWLVDGVNTENIVFRSIDFADITKATAEEITATINRQTQFSYAVPYFDNITKNTFVRMFTNTIGSKGSLQVVGGLANVVLQFNGFNMNAGNGANTQWTVSKVGQTVTFAYTGGNSPNLSQIQVGDVVTINLPDNIGSFAITNINLAANTLTFVNLFATPGIYTETDVSQVKFFTPNKYVAYTNNQRAMTWEVREDQIVVEMPTSPPVVQRSLIGSIHLNGETSQIVSYDSATALTLTDGTNFLNSGKFVIQPLNGRLIGAPQKYTYTSRTAATTTGDTVMGLAQILNVASTAGIAIGQNIVMIGVPQYAKVTSIVGNTINLDQIATANNVGIAVSFLGNQLTGITPNLDPSLAVTGATVILTSAVPSSISRIKGPYIWDNAAPFVLSENQAQIQETIQAGQVVRLLSVSENTIPVTGGSLIFDYGLNTQEGPVKYLSAPNDTALILDPTYIFQYDHSINSAIVAIESFGPHIMSGLGTEYPPYITDPSQARSVIEGLITSVKSAGIFIEFLIRYPEQLYSLYNVYDQ